MSRSADRDRRDGGFTLVEIIVALGILMVVVTALLPQLVVGIRSTGTARMVSQAKGVAQGQLDRMRNMPFHVSPAAGDYRDVLDFYYRNLTAGSTPTCMSAGKYLTPQPGWAGYVSAAATRCAYEPSGAFYRYVDTVPATAGSGGFTVVVDTQFLSGATPPAPVTPPTGYNTQTTGKDNPASSQIGITVTALYNTRGTLHPVSTYTQISDQPTSTTRVRAEAHVTALEGGSITPANGAVSLSAGLVNLIGSLTYASTVQANLSGVSAGLSTGLQASGATAVAAAPPSTTTGTTSSTEGWLTSATCPVACWGGSTVSMGVLSAENALPNAGSQTSPLQALVTDMTRNGISFGNGPAGDFLADLELATPLVAVNPDATPGASGIVSGCVGGGAGSSSYIAGSGYLTTTATAVESCAVARTSLISLFPTTFAPKGVIQVELKRASTRCLVQGAAHAATTSFDYEAVVRYRAQSGGYQDVGTISPGMTSDLLDGVDLGTPVADGLTLGSYIASWSSLTADEVTPLHAGGVARVALPGVVTISSQPVGSDPASAVSVTIGAVSCSAEDQR